MDRYRSIIMALSLILGVLLYAHPVWADKEGKEVKVRGVVASIGGGGDAFLLQELVSRAGGPALFWVVRVSNKTKIEMGDKVGEGHGVRAVLALLRVGDVVQVKGRTVDRQHIAATKVERQEHLAKQPAVVRIHRPVRPPNVPEILPPLAAFPSAPVILAPPNGADIGVGAFTVVGRTVPGAQVRFTVSGQFAVFQLPLAQGEVVANEHGIFAFTVDPLVQAPGFFYRIAVTATLGGITSPPSTIVVRRV